MNQSNRMNRRRQRELRAPKQQPCFSAFRCFRRPRNGPCQAPRYRSRQIPPHRRGAKVCAAAGLALAAKLWPRAALHVRTFISHTMLSPATMSTSRSSKINHKCARGIFGNVALLRHHLLHQRVAHAVQKAAQIVRSKKTTWKQERECAARRVVRQRLTKK